MCINITIILTLILLLVDESDQWKAVPAHETAYDSKDAYVGVETGLREADYEHMPRDTLHSVYKFGWCTPDIIVPGYLRYSKKTSINTFEETKSPFIYFLREHVLRKNVECTVAKVYTPASTMLKNSMVPFSFCQGNVFIQMFNQVRRYQLNEFYLPNGISKVSDIVYETYYP